MSFATFTVAELTARLTLVEMKVTCLPEAQVIKQEARPPFQNVAHACVLLPLVVACLTDMTFFKSSREFYCGKRVWGDRFERHFFDLLIDCRRVTLCLILKAFHLSSKKASFISSVFDFIFCFIVKTINEFVSISFLFQIVQLACRICVFISIFNIIG